MIELHLLRHAHAGDARAWDGPDATRPLSDTGRRQIQSLARLLGAAGFASDAIISSPKIRALQTAEILGEAVSGSVQVDDRLAGGLDLPTVGRILADANGPTRPVLVGHDPDLSWLLSTLAGSEIPMRTGAMARVDLEEWERPRGTLRWLLPPELFGG